MIHNLMFRDTIERKIQEKFKNEFPKSPLVHFGNLNRIIIGNKYKYCWNVGPKGRFKACISPVYIRILFEISNILLNALESSGNCSVLDVEMNITVSQIIDLSTKLLFYHPSCGLETAIDDSNTYAGIIRNKNTDYFNSTVIITNGNFIKNIKDLYPIIFKNKGKLNKLIIMPLDQIVEYSREQMQDFSIDSTGKTSLYLDDIPIICIDDNNLTDTKVMAIDLNKRIFAYGPSNVKEVGKINDSTKFEIIIGLLFALNDPKKSSKIVSW